MRLRYPDILAVRRQNVTDKLDRKKYLEIECYVSVSYVLSIFTALEDAIFGRFTSNLVRELLYFPITKQENYIFYGYHVLILRTDFDHFQNDV